MHRHEGVDWECGDKCPICWYQNTIAAKDEEIARLTELERVLREGNSKLWNRNQKLWKLWQQNVAGLNREIAQWQEQAGQAAVMAEQLEDALAQCERERDAAAVRKWIAPEPSKETALGRPFGEWWKSLGGAALYTEEEASVTERADKAERERDEEAAKYALKWDLNEARSERDEAAAQCASLIEQNAELIRQVRERDEAANMLRYLVDRGMIIPLHERGCPEDDTCACDIVGDINNILANHSYVPE